jgi:ADP-ribosylglycohydrolase
MRILPIALRFREETAQRLAELARRASSLTHGHLRSQMACALYVLVVKELLRGLVPAEALRSALAAFHEIYRDTAFAGEMGNFRSLDPDRLRSRPEREIDSSGYVIHTLTASLWCLLTTDNFTDTVLKAVNLGYDTDTTGTVTGGLAGAFYGLEAIPQDWKRGLARHDDVAALFQRFLSVRLNVSAIASA